MKLLLTAAIAGLLGYLAVKYWKGRRGRAMLRVAAEASISLEDYGPEVSVLAATGLPLFIDGRGGFGRFLLRMPPADGARGYYFDYSCALGEGGERREKHATVALFEFEKGAFPDFHLDAGGEIPGETTGLEPADMAALEGFPQGSQLYCRDLVAAGKYFTPERAACFAEHPGWSAQGAGRYIALYKGCALAAPGDYIGFMAEAEKLAFNLS